MRGCGRGLAQVLQHLEVGQQPGVGVDAEEKTRHSEVGSQTLRMRSAAQVEAADGGADISIAKMMVAGRAAHAL